MVELFAIRDQIDPDPPYQRISVWNLEKKRLFIDSVLNKVDIPKIYLHELPRSNNGSQRHRYSIIDGKQRILALWEFMSNKIRLANDFEFFDVPEVRAGGATYDQLLAKFPVLRGRFDSFDVPIVIVRAENERVVEDLFSRLNVAVPLSAPEYRNALGGPLPLAIRRLAKERLLGRYVTISKARYQHFDLAAKFLYLTRYKGFNSTKKENLNRFVTDTRDAHLRKEEWASWDSVDQLESEALLILKGMRSLFKEGDPLLGSQGRITLYFHMFRLLQANDWEVSYSRNELSHFKVQIDYARRKSQRMANGSGESLSSTETLLLDFDREKQSINDGGALRRQYGLMRQYFRSAWEIDFPDPD